MKVLIGHGAPSGASDGNSSKWVLVIFVVAYRDEHNHLVKKSLRFELPISKRKLSKAMDSLEPYQIIEVEIEDDSNPNCVILNKILKRNCRDQDLDVFARELLKPITIETSEFGQLVYRRDLEFFSGNVEWCNKPIELCLECGNPEQSLRVLNAAKSLFSKQPIWQGRVEKLAISELLSLKNDSWLEEDQEVVSAEQFLEKMNLQSISIDGEGEFTFWHEDGDLFWGHTIQVSGDLESGVKYADVAG